MLDILVWEEDSNTVFLCDWAGAVVVTPDNGQEKRTSGTHDSDVGEHPAAVISWKSVHDLEEEGMVGNAAHGIIADTGGHGSADPCGIDKERVERSLTTIVEIDVDAAKVGENKVSNGIGALNREAIAIEGFEKPRVPEHVRGESLVFMAARLTQRQ